MTHRDAVRDCNRGKGESDTSFGPNAFLGPVCQARTGQIAGSYFVAGRNQTNLRFGEIVLLETNGSLPIQGIDSRVRRIVDVKCPGSGMSGHNLWANLEILTPRDEVKFVITDRDDFTWALEVAEKYSLIDRLPVLISPVFGAVSLPEVAAWILESGLPLRLNLQLHKYIWGPEARGV